MLSNLLLVAWMGCQGLDLGTTVAALQRPAVVEANPVIRGRRLAAVKVGINVGFLIWRGHRKNATHRNIMAGIFAAEGCVPGAMNLRTLRQ